MIWCDVQKEKCVRQRSKQDTQWRRGWGKNDLKERQGNKGNTKIRS